MGKSERKRPKIKKEIDSGKSPSIAPQNNPDKVLDKYPSWKFFYLDENYPWSPFKLDNKNTIKDILEKLKNFEKMKWKDISGKNHHYLNYHSLSNKAKKELERIDVQEVFSFRLSGRNRLIGIRENEYFYIIWWDPDHSFCPSNKKHT